MFRKNRQTFPPDSHMLKIPNLRKKQNMQQQRMKQNLKLLFELPRCRCSLKIHGIMFNSNYIRAFDRALHMSTTKYNGQRLQHSHGISTQHEGWSVVSVQQQRFGAPPRLGETFVIEGKMEPKSVSFADEDEKEHSEVWDMELKSVDGTTVYNTAKGLKVQVLSKNPDNHPNLSRVVPFDLEKLQPNLITPEDVFTVYRDEFDAHWQGHLPLRTILNLFERSRTNALGGPEGLRRLQEGSADDGHPVVVVVTSISDVTLVDEGAILEPGQAVAVETAIVVKRKGMVMECYQTLRTASADTANRLAQGKVSLMLLDATSMRPTSKLPKWARELLHMELKE